MKIGQALKAYYERTTIPLDQWLELANNPHVPTPIRTPLRQILDYNHQQYCIMCKKLGIVPLSLGKWLTKDVSTCV